MGEFVELDVRQLRTVAARVSDAATRIAEMPWPSFDPDALAGARVAGAAETCPVPPRLAAAVTAMQAWAAAARTAADAFDDAERRNGGRFAR
ncbi:hypothetical protein H7J88_15410 [Mycolicibacterium flavescens]|uniref:ESX-1 secretion-associated protein n=1 Tax=Mycolicibacterium flavescens TaxID=1776 RepID=A0A1E3RKD7_MYCFV|nr:hypothetical protein [Mycolicibacterium flavescens]MCV7281030.1 hypothetical protein [Mycolicibacterium flavescens]ODQ90331.1 hypothetical protein BHQ18_09700 [Mycolicibacterium flavescens]